MIKPPAPKPLDQAEDDPGLTSIHGRIHCAATQDADDNDELDRIAIDNFLQTLADVALSIAKRRAPVD